MHRHEFTNEWKLLDFADNVTYLLQFGAVLWQEK